MDDSSIMQDGMSSMRTVTDLIARWPSRRDLAEDAGVPLHSVHKWAQRSRIPSELQYPVIQAAWRRGFTDVTAEWMIWAHRADQ